MANLYVNLSKEKDGLTNMIKNLTAYENDIIAIKSATQKLVDDRTKLTSNAYDDAKLYFDMYHIKTLQLLLKNISTLKGVNSLYSSAIDKTCAKASTNILDEQKIRDRIEQLNGLIKDEIDQHDRVKDGNPLSSSPFENKSKVHIYNQELKILADDLEALTDLHVVTNEIYIDIDAAVHSLKNKVDRMSKAKRFSNGNYTRYIKGVNFDYSEQLAEIATTSGKYIKILEYCGDPVNMSTGTYIYEKEFLRSHNSLGLSFELTYNSKDELTNTLGYAGFCHNHDITMHITNNDVKIKMEDGQELRYFKKGNEYENSYGNIDRTLKREIIDGELYLVLKDAEKNVYLFDQTGLLKKRLNVNGHSNIYNYNEDRTLSSVQNIFGYSLSFEYSLIEVNCPESKKEILTLLSKVHDHNGRYIEIEYENGNLTMIKNESGDPFTYSYDNHHRLISVSNPREITTVVNEYDGTGRVIKQSFPDDGEMQYKYFDNEKKVVFTDQIGNKTEFYHDNKFRSTKVVYEDGTRYVKYNERNEKVWESDKKGYETKYSYTDKGELKDIVNQLGEKTEISYSENGKISSINQSNQVQVSADYDESGNMTSFRDGENREVKISYNKQNLPNKLTYPDNSSVLLDYDDRGNIIKLTEELGNELHYKYDALGRVIKSIDGNGNETCFEYDEKNNITKTINSNGDICEYEYNKSNKITLIKDFNGTTIKREYNALNKVSKAIDKNGNETKFRYDKRWNLYKVKTPTGAEVIYLYDKLNRLKTVMKQGKTYERYEYDPNGNIIKVIDALGNRRIYEYDQLNRIRSIIDESGYRESVEYDSWGNIVKFNDKSGNEYIYEYNKVGEIIKETDPLSNIIEYEYTPLGDIKKITENNKKITKYEYYPGGKLKRIIHPGEYIEELNYDKNGNIIKRSVGEFETHYQYDNLNRVIKIDNPEKGNTQLKYDSVSNIIEVIDGNGSCTKYDYSHAGELIRVTDPLGNITEYDYDKSGNLVAIKQADEGLANALRITKYERDPLGRINEIINPLGYSEKYYYDYKDRVIKKIDRDDNKTEYAYTPDGNLENIKYADGRHIKYRYNALGQLIAIEDILGKTSIKRDTLGREVSVTDHRNKSVTYEWDEFGNKSSITYPDGKTVKYLFDDTDTLRELKVGDEVINYHYDNNGFMNERLFSNGIKTNYRISPGGNVKELVNSSNDGIIDKFTYEYDNVGNKTQVTKQRKNISIDAGVFEYIYDDLNRLTRVKKDNHILRSFEYDTFGNRISETLNDKTINYEYNSLNQIVKKQESDKIHIYSYDKRGNLTMVQAGDELINSYEFDTMGRLKKAVNKNNEIAIYKYNGLGLRISKSLVDDRSQSYEKIDYILDQTKQYNNLLQMNSDTISQSYIWDTNPILMYEGDDINGLLQDDMGSTIGLTDNTGNIIEGYGFDEFGVPVNQNKKQPFGFTGYIQDKISNTFFAQAREYLPEIGRFTGQDIIEGYKEAPHTLNEYIYCWNNPQKYVDLNGMTPTVRKNGYHKGKGKKGGAGKHGPNYVDAPTEEYGTTHWGVEAGVEFFNIERSVSIEIIHDKHGYKIVVTPVGFGGGPKANIQTNKIKTPKKPFFFGTTFTATNAEDYNQIKNDPYLQAGGTMAAGGVHFLGGREYEGIKISVGAFGPELELGVSHSDIWKLIEDNVGKSLE